MDHEIDVEVLLRIEGCEETARIMGACSIWFGISGSLVGLSLLRKLPALARVWGLGFRVP